jgi:hypothetical protein
VHFQNEPELEMRAEYSKGAVFVGRSIASFDSIRSRRWITCSHKGVSGSPEIDMRAQKKIIYCECSMSLEHVVPQMVEKPVSQSASQLVQVSWKPENVYNHEIQAEAQ